MPVNSFEDYKLTWCPQKEHLKSPYFKSIAAMLEQDILSGRLSSGTKLPPQRELADYLDIHFTTVTKAYEECKKKNLIYGVTGSGTFVSPQSVKPITNSMDTMLRHVEALRYDAAIEMGFSSSFEQTNQIVLDSLLSLIPNCNFNFSYRDPTGSAYHKQIALQWMSQFGIHAPESQVAIVSGSMNALTICMLSLFKSGDRIAIDFYVNNNVIELAKLLSIQLIPIKMDADGMIPEAVEQACEQYSIKGLYLMPSCNNPTTIRIPLSRKVQLSNIIQKYGLIVMEDDPFAFCSVPPLSDHAIPMRELLPEQTIYICNTTTSICSGIRIAFLVFPHRFLEAIHSAICNINVKTSAFDVEVICQLIQSGIAKQIADKKTALSREANAIFNEIFPNNRQGNPCSFFRWLEIPKSFRNDTIGWELLSRGIHVYHSRRFLCGKDEDTSYLRIALSSTDSLEQLREGLLKIRDYLFSQKDPESI